MGRYTKAYSGTLAVVCAGSVAVAVQANEKAARLAELRAKADRWETWGKNERRRDPRAYARFSEVARQYRTLAREVGRSQQALRREIAVTRSLHRKVVTGSPIITYVRVRKIVPVVTAAAASTVIPATATAAAAADTATKQKPLTTRKPKKQVAKPPAGTQSGSSASGQPTTTAPADPGAQGGGSTPGTSPPPGGDPSGGGTAPPPPPPPPLAAPANTRLPSIIGQPQSGKTFSADPGSWTGNPTSFTYQWQRCDASGGSCIVVGSAQTYTCVPQDIDKTMRVAVEAKNATGSAIAVSAASPKTKPS
jgi:hypothetical protein